MTAPTTAVPDFQRDQILTAAIRLTGILSYGRLPSADQLAATNVHFNLVLDELMSDNIVRKQVERTTLALVSGTASYDLPVETLDIELGPNDAAGTVGPGDGSAETQVMAMSLGDYMKIAVKSTLASRPSRVYIEKKDLTTLVFWPVPSDSTLTFNYARIRMLFQSGTGITTMDLRRQWTAYVVYAVAVGVCLDNSLFEKAGMLKQWAAEKKALAQAGDADRGNIRFRIGHSGRNW